MNIVVDTNIWLYAAAGFEPAIALLDKASSAAWGGYSAITRLELLGYPDLKLSDETRIMAMLKCFNESEVNSQVIDQAIRIRKNKRIKVPDAIIAATAVIRDASLATRNVDDFKGIRELKIINPFA